MNVQVIKSYERPADSVYDPAWVMLGWVYFP